jgi:hypothetical protein
MRNMGVRSLLVYAPTIAAATRSQSAATSGPMKYGYPTLRRDLSAASAAIVAPMCDRISTGAGSTQA